MNQQIVITDASPLIALARIGRIHLLRDLFSEVWITETVRQEVLLGGEFNDAASIDAAIRAGWLQVELLPETLPSPVSVAAYVAGLDPGETSAILWAAGLQQTGQRVLLIMDEMKGRAVARRLSLEIMGSAGIIATAKRLGLIPQARPLLEQLQASGYYLSPVVAEMALKMAGEV